MFILFVFIISLILFYLHPSIFTYFSLMFPFYLLFCLLKKLRYSSHIIIVTTLKCTVYWFLVYSQICATITSMKFHIFITTKRNPVSIISQPLQPLATSNLLSVSMDLPILDISYKWNHAIGGLLCLAFFT